MILYYLPQVLPWVARGPPYLKPLGLPWYRTSFGRCMGHGGPNSLIPTRGIMKMTAGWTSTPTQLNRRHRLEFAMGRKAKPFKMILLRTRIRSEYLEAVRAELAKLNFFNPEKPYHGDMSSLVEQLFLDWLKERLSDEDFKKLPERKENRL